MVENDRKINLDGLREQIRGPITNFSEKLIAALGEQLQSITVVGSSLTDDYRPGQSDINTVLVLTEKSLDSLNKLAAMAKKMKRKKIAAPLLMTTDYIERSRDVFGIELLDLQLNHKTVLGNDPFAELKFSKTDVRLQCERELKAALIRMRQGYIVSAANKRLVRDILISTVGGLVPLLRAVLWLKDIDRSKPAGQVFKTAAEKLSVDVESLIKVTGWRHKKVRLKQGQITSAFESVYATVDKLAGLVDKLEV
ncbi:MAG: hypothetical protein ACYSRR_05075 [Planctomycetota bacterium]|jgi:hypothetical protein